MNSNEQMMRRRFGKRRFIKVPFIIAAIVLVKSAVVMLLWNYLIPDLFHGPTLDYLQAMGITVLAKLLVGMGGGPRGFGGGHRGFGGHHWNREKWANMTPEEREKLRDELRNRCGR